MKSLLYLTIFLILACGGQVFSQPFYGFQSIGKHTCFFGVKWDGKASLSLGYVYRAGGGTSFRDFSAEWQFPFEDIFQFDNSEVIVGIYGPLRQRERPFWGMGAHVRGKRAKDESIQNNQFQIGITGMPSYTFAGILSERPYPTAGARLTYYAVIYEEERSSEGEQTGFFPFHGAELGGHLDVMFERTLGVAANVYFRRKWNLQSEQLPSQGTSWEGEGDVYFGPTYNLRRW